MATLFSALADTLPPGRRGKKNTVAGVAHSGEALLLAEVIRRQKSAKHSESIAEGSGGAGDKSGENGEDNSGDNSVNNSEVNEVNKPAGVFFIADTPLTAYHLIEELAFFAPDITARYLPDWETLPYDAYSPPAEIVSRRLTTLVALLDGAFDIVIASVAAMALPCAPPAFVAGRAFALQTGAALSLSAFSARLAQSGYARVDRVLAQGEYAIYGGQIDVFPPDTKLPLRLVLFDDEIEQIRLFDPETQRSVERIENFALLPMSECDLSPDGRRRFCKNYDAQFEDDRAGVRRRIEKNETVAGIEYYLPLFYEQPATVFDYLPAGIEIIMRDNPGEALAAFLHQARLRQKTTATYEGRPALPAQSLFLSQEQFFKKLRERPLTELKAPRAQTGAPQLPADARAKNPQEKLAAFIEQFSGKVVIVVDSEGRREALLEILLKQKPRRADTFADCMNERLSIAVAALRGGFILPAKLAGDEKIAVITENEIFQTALPPRARRTAATAAGATLYANEIRDGDYVVHREYGIGVARGLKNIVVDGKMSDYLEIEYADGQQLFLPVGQLHFLQRYHSGDAGVNTAAAGNVNNDDDNDEDGDNTAAPITLSKMGSRNWKKTMARAEKRATDAAARMLEINARRAAADTKGHSTDEAMLAKFIDGFRHAETPDQRRAADEALNDLRQDKPMDRLIAADVGFGKTEVAMRAAAHVAFAGGQVALMAPTTILAQQHYNAFCERFAGFPVKIAALTRLTTAPDRSKTLAALAAGDVDIIIGTHALLNKRIRYNRLGLAVIDEEHRFGVRHKEKFKSLRAGVDVLALSATPIPRTLSMALGGIRDLSIISTPPANRLEIKTIDAPFSHAIVAEACERELMRGGQIFFIHNEIRTLPDMAAQLQKWLPRARIIIAHGGMTGNTLEDAMRRFLRRQGEILLCTTIVESGLDITNANTIVINRADKMGLSRLHQLRGRVGRGGAQAYAYFLRPTVGDINRRAEARLAAARDYGALGGGFILAMRDLEIRGAGEILGERQSGEIEAVGFAMYQSMVNNAARRLRGEPDAPATDSVADEVTLPAAALLPAEYIHSPAERLRYYRRLAACDNSGALNDALLELEDRFGKPPPAAQMLKESHRLRLLMRPIGATALRISADGVLRVTFAPNPPCAEALVQKITVGDCAPTSKHAIRRRLNAEEPLPQAIESGDFLRELGTLNS